MGSIRASMNSMNSWFRPGKPRRENANAAIDPSSKTNRTVVPVITMVLRPEFGIFARSQTSRYPLKSMAVGTKKGLSRSSR